MNKPKAIQEDAAIKRVTWIGIVSLLILLFFFLFVTLLSTTKLTSQIKLLTEHPFTVSSNISDAKTDLALMQLRAERLQSYNQPEDVAKVGNALDELYADLDMLLEEVDDLYLGPEEDTDALWLSFQEIQDAQEDLLEFAALPTSTTDLIAVYEAEHLYLLYEEFEASAERVLTYVRNTQQSIFTSAHRLGSTSRTWSVIIVTGMTVGLFFSSPRSEG